MSLFGSLYTSVSGMYAQSQHTASISTNIANMTTIGYKKTDTVFHDLVLNKTRSNNFANGGVLTGTILRANQQGALLQTSSTTEMGIVGDGFFSVKSREDDALPFLYTRNGTFTPDSTGLMRNAAGFILYGWPVDANGNVSTGPTTDSLVPVDVDEFDSSFRATTLAALSLNLNSSETPYNAALFGGLPVSDANPTWNNLTLSSTDTSQAAHFSRNMTVYDGAGNPREMTFEFRKVTGPMAQATSNNVGLSYDTLLTDAAYFPGAAAGDTVTLNTGAGVEAFTIAGGSTVGDLINFINTTFGGGTEAIASLDGNGRLIVRAEDMADTLTLGGTMVTGGAMTFTTLAAQDPSVTYADQGLFPPYTAATNSNGWWEMRVVMEADDAYTTQLIPNPAFETDPTQPQYINNPLFISNPGLAGTPADYNQPNVLATGLLNFDSQGRLNVARDPVTGGFLNPDDGILTVSTGNISSLFAAEDLTIDIDISRLSQYSGNYNVINASQNGIEAGILSGVNIDREGRVIATFSNGERMTVAQVPLANFINPNGLKALTGTVFQETTDSGEPEILTAGTGGAGLIEASTVEQSNVDLADEFAHLIVSQRAFSANSKVVNTIDEMTQLLRQLKV